MPYFAGYPIKIGYAHYALYDIALDRFVFVCDGRELGLRVQQLAMSRYHMALIQLDWADNYQHNLIDNTICENWTYQRSNYDDHWNVTVHGVIRAEKLIGHDIAQFDTASIQRRKQWMQVYWHWLRFVQALPALIISNHRMRSLMQTFDTGLAEVYHQTMANVQIHKNWIIRALVFGNDPTECHDSIGSYVQSNKELDAAYRRLALP